MKFYTNFPVIPILVVMYLLCSAVTKAETINIVYTHENRAFGELLNSFEENSDHKINVVWIDQSDLKSRMVGLLAIKDVPDVLIVPADSLGMAEYSGLSQIPQNLINTNMAKKALETVTFGDKILGIPIVQGNHLLLYYNKTLVKDPAKSWEKLIEQKTQLKQGVQLISWSYMEMYWFIPFITAFGEFPVINDEPNLNTNSMRKALAYVWQLANDNIVDQRCNYPCVEERFKSDKSAYVINGIWAYQTYKEVMGDQLGVSQLPTLSGKTMRPYFSTIVAAFPKESLTASKKDAVNEFAQFIQSDAFQESLWSTLREIPSNQLVFNRIQANTTPEYKRLLNTLGNTIPMSSDRNMAIIWEVMLKGYLRFGSGIWNANKTTDYMQNLAVEHINIKNESKSQ